MKKTSLFYLLLLSLFISSCESTLSSNTSSSDFTSNLISSSTDSSSSSTNQDSSTSSSIINITEKQIIIDSSNFNSLNQIELTDVIENTTYPEEFTFKTGGVLKSNQIQGITKISIHVYQTYENLFVYNNYTGEGSSLIPTKEIGNKEATYTYQFNGENKFYIANSSEYSTHVYSITITYTGDVINNSNINSSSSISDINSSSATLDGDYQGEYYTDTDLTLQGNELKLELRDLITTTHTTIITYGDLREKLRIADASLTDSSKFVSFYTHIEINSTWDNGTTWNREHVLPQSIGWWGEAKNNSMNAGSDLHHVRAEDTSLNSSRGNKPFGNVTNGSEAKMKASSSSGCYSDTTYFEPQDCAKGDVARVLFYMLTRYSEADSVEITSIASSMDLLLEWNELDPVDELETQRNNVTEEIQGNRNPFIDYPILANNIWNTIE